MEILHGKLHIRVGENNSQMSSKFAPLDPIFYLHHAHFDFLWTTAQAGWNANRMPLDSRFKGVDVNGVRSNAKIH
jgi:hypothetical protein